MLAEQLQSTSRALVDRDPGHAELAMRRLRRNKAEVQALTDAVEGAREATTLSPYSWRRRRACSVTTPQRRNPSTGPCATPEL
ncbi:hypothetical protein V2I01_17750 [Micromonospora sp. BRA006-A]|nr:hypothetical protein [Micromonospora sp. BRA006-A]